MESERRWPVWKVAYFGLMFLLGLFALFLVSFLVALGLTHTSLTGL